MRKSIGTRCDLPAHWHRQRIHLGFAGPSTATNNRRRAGKVSSMEQIRVCTYDGPGAQPVIRNVPWPKIPKKAALIKVGACGVCGTDLHILKGHWPKPLPWPFTLGHEIGGVLVEIGSEFSEDFMSKPLKIGSKVMIPPLMPCGHCYYCIHYPLSANKCLTPVYYGRYLGFDKAPHLWGGWAEYVYVDLEMLPGTKIYKLPDDMSLRLGALSEPLTSCIRAFNRASRAGGFSWGDTVVIQGSGPIGILAVAAKVSTCCAAAVPMSRWASSPMPVRSRRHGAASAPRSSTCWVRGDSPATICRSASTCSIAPGTNTPGWRCRRSIRSRKRASAARSRTRWR